MTNFMISSRSMSMHQEPDGCGQDANDDNNKNNQRDAPKTDLEITDIGIVVHANFLQGQRKAI